MTRTVEVSVIYFNNVNRLPPVEDIRSSIRHCLVKLFGEIGAGKFVFQVVEDSLKLEEKKFVNFQVRIDEATDKSEIRQFCAALVLIKAIGNDRVAVRLISDT